MIDDTTVAISDPVLSDELKELLGAGAHRLIREAVQAELERFSTEPGGIRDAEGRRAVVRNGYLPEREVLAEVRPVMVQVPILRGEIPQGGGAAGERP